MEEVFAIISLRGKINVYQGQVSIVLKIYKSIINEGKVRCNVTLQIRCSLQQNMCVIYHYLSLSLHGYIKLHLLQNVRIFGISIHIFEKFQRDLVHTGRFYFAIMNHNDFLDNGRINLKGYLLVILMLRLVMRYR